MKQVENYKKYVGMTRGSHQTMDVIMTNPDGSQTVIESN